MTSSWLAPSGSTHTSEIPSDVAQVRAGLRASAPSAARGSGTPVELGIHERHHVDPIGIGERTSPDPVNGDPALTAQVRPIGTLTVSAAEQQSVKVARGATVNPFCISTVRASQGGVAKADWVSFERCQRSEVRIWAAGTPTN